MIVASSVREVGAKVVFFVVVAEFRDGHDGRCRRVDIVLGCPLDASAEILELAEELEGIHLLEVLLLQKVLVNERLVLAERLFSERFRFDEVLRHLLDVSRVLRIQIVEAVLVYDLRIVLAEVEHLGFLDGQELVEGGPLIHLSLVLSNGSLWVLQYVVVIALVVPEAERVSADQGFCSGKLVESAPIIWNVDVVNVGEGWQAIAKLVGDLAVVWIDLPQL